MINRVLYKSTGLLWMDRWSVRSCTPGWAKYHQLW